MASVSAYEDPKDTFTLSEKPTDITGKSSEKKVLFVCNSQFTSLIHTNFSQIFLSKCKERTVLACFTLCFIANYSEGDAAGYLQKLK